MLRIWPMLSCRYPVNRVARGQGKERGEEGFAVVMEEHRTGLRLP